MMFTQLRSPDYRWRCLLILSVLVLIGFLVGPRVPAALQKKYCVVNLKLVSPFGISLNCDAAEFLHEAYSPGELLKKNDIRQSRPGLILLAHVVSLPFHGVVHLILLASAHGFISRLLHMSAGRTIFAQQFLPVYFAYETLNLTILFFSLLLFRQLVLKTTNSRTFYVSTALIGILLIANDVNKVYFWSPHTSLFNILVPLFCVWTLWLGLQCNLIGKKIAYWLALGAGLGITAYGTFLLFIPMLVISALVQFSRNIHVNQIKTLVFHGMGLSVVFFLPTLLWYCVVRYNVGHYYVDAFSRFHLFAWMTSALHSGWVNFLSLFWMHFRLCVLSALMQGVCVLGLFVLLLICRYWCLPREIVVCDMQLRQLIIIAAIISSLIILLNVSAGYIWPRVIFSAVVPWIVVIGAFAQKIAKKISHQTILNRFNAVVLLSVAGIVTYQWVKMVPYFY